MDHHQPEEGGGNNEGRRRHQQQQYAQGDQSRRRERPVDPSTSSAQAQQQAYMYTAPQHQQELLLAQQQPQQQQPPPSHASYPYGLPVPGTQTSVPASTTTGVPALPPTSAGGIDALQAQNLQQCMYAQQIYPAPLSTYGYTSQLAAEPGSAGAVAAAVAQAAAAQQQQQQQQQQALFYQQQQHQALAAAAAVAVAAVPPGLYASSHPLVGQASATGSGLVSSGVDPMAVASSAVAASHAASVAGATIPPKIGRLPANRPVVKLSVSLIDTYKHINTVYYEERDARRAARAKEKAKSSGGAGGEGVPGAGGANNSGWDDDNYDYIVTPGELFYGRYRMFERIGKGSFGQVVRAEDVETKREVAIKIIKSKKPFLVQAKTEIELLTQLCEKDAKDQHNLVRLLTHFVYRNHQCLVFEMLSLNLYELLKNTQFGGVSLNLIRKFAKQVLRALSFLARPDVDIIHCDLKPENILLRHPKKSAIKVIDFGSSCRSNKRMYSYIQSRFYRSPEVMLGLPYGVPIDMWSLGCILVEMHTGEPLFSGSDQFDQMQKIVKLLGMVPSSMLERSSDQIKFQFFEKRVALSGADSWSLRQTKPSKAESSSSPPAPSSVDQPAVKDPIVPSLDPMASLAEVITAGSRNKKKNYPPSEAYNSALNYELFVDLVYKMLAYHPEDRIKPKEALQHPFIVTGDPAATAAAVAAAAAAAMGPPTSGSGTPADASTGTATDPGATAATG